MSVHRCGRCNRPFKVDEGRTHSVWSGLSYCWAIAACGKRAEKFLNRPEMKWLRSATRN